MSYLYGKIKRKIKKYQCFRVENELIEICNANQDADIVFKTTICQVIAIKSYLASVCVRFSVVIKFLFFSLFACFKDYYSFHRLFSPLAIILR